MLELILGILSVVIFGWFTLAAVRRLDQREQYMRLAARRFGFVLTGDCQISGEVDGLQVEQWHEWIRERDGQRPTVRTSCSFARALPPEVRLTQRRLRDSMELLVRSPKLPLGDDLDRSFVLRCPHETEAVELFNDPEVQRLLRVNAEAGRTLLIEEHRLFLTGFDKEVHQFDRLLRQAIALSKAIGAAVDQPLNDVASQHGLTQGDQPRSAGCPPA